MADPVIGLAEDVGLRSAELVKEHQDRIYTQTSRLDGDLPWWRDYGVARNPDHRPAARSLHAPYRQRCPVHTNSEGQGLRAVVRYDDSAHWIPHSNGPSGVNYPVT